MQPASAVPVRSASSCGRSDGHDRYDSRAIAEILRKSAFAVFAAVLAFSCGGAVFAQQRKALSENDVKQLIRDLQKPKASDRLKVTERIGDTKDVRGIDALIVALRDKEFHVRAKVAWALGEIGDRRAVEPLLACLGDSTCGADTGAHTSLDPKYQIVRALGKFRDSRALPALVSVLEEPVDPKIVNPYPKEYQNAAFSVLAEFGQPSVPLLIPFLNHRVRSFREAAVETLGKTKVADAVEPLLAALQDSNSAVREKAATALKAIGEPAVQPLILRLAHSNSAVRIEAARALVKIEDTRGANALMVGVREDNLPLITGAYQFVIRRGESGTEPALIRALGAYGTVTMAKHFAMCGNASLRQAAEDWFRKERIAVDITRSGFRFAVATAHPRALEMIESVDDMDGPPTWGSR